CASFFFSSRRRHTRSDRDWSSDVCSSDLLYWRDEFSATPSSNNRNTIDPQRGRLDGRARSTHVDPEEGSLHAVPPGCHRRSRLQIGRASCRERGGELEVGGAGKGKRREMR